LSLGKVGAGEGRGESDSVYKKGGNSSRGEESWRGALNITRLCLGRGGGGTSKKKTQKKKGKEEGVAASPPTEART